jgi:hypothetical protein
MDDRCSLRPWIVENWSRMALPFAVLILCSLPIFLTANNVSLILLGLLSGAATVRQTQVTVGRHVLELDHPVRGESSGARRERYPYVHRCIGA